MAMAQQVLVVQFNGGTPYQTIQQAVVAANHGDIIRVMPGIYGGFSCNKAVRFEGGGGVVTINESPGIPAVTVSGLPANGQFSMHSINLWRSSANPRIEISGPGRVLLDNIRESVGDAPRLTVTSLTGGLLLNQCRFGNLSSIQGTTVHAAACEWRGDGSYLSGQVLSLFDTSMHIVDGSLSFNYTSGGSGFRLVNSRLTLGAVNGLQLIGPPLGWPVPNYHFDIDATSSVVQHTAVTPAAPSFAAGQNNWVRNDSPVSLRVATAGPGGTVTTTTFGSGPLELVVLFVGSQVNNYTLTGVAGPLFIANSTFVVNLGFVITTGAPVGLSFGVPSAPSLAGFPLVAQGITVSSRMTNAVGFTLR